MGGSLATIWPGCGPRLKQSPTFNPLIVRKAVSFYTLLLIFLIDPLALGRYSLAQSAMKKSPTSHLDRLILGRGQVVRHRFLVSCIVGSNPTAPAKFS